MNADDETPSAHEPRPSETDAAASPTDGGFFAARGPENLPLLAANLFELDTHAIFLADVQTERILESNATASRLYGYSSEEFKRLTIPQLSDDPEAARQAAQDQESFVPHRVHLKKDGTRFPAEASLKRFLLGGRPTLFMAIRDIGKRIAFQEKLRLAETMAANSPVVLFQCGPEPGRPIEYVSENVSRFGYAPEELAGGRFLFDALIHPEDRARTAEAIAERLRSLATSFCLRHRMRAKNGRIVHVEDNVFVERDAVGRIRHFQEVVRDVTEQEEARRAGRENEALFQALFSAVQDAIFILDPSFRILIVNAEGARRHGMSRGEIIGEDYLALMPPETAVRSRDKLQRVLARKEPVRFVSSRSDRRFDSAAYPIFDEDGAVTQIAIFSRDVTRLYAIQRKLREAKNAADKANRAKTAFLANMSHEIRTPIHAVNGMLELLLADCRDPSQKNRLLRIKETVAHLNHVIADVLDMSKIESGRLELEAVRFNLPAMVQEALESVEAMAAAKGLSVRLALAADMPAIVRGDPLRLRQVLLNLLTNAVKFTNQGAISLSAAKSREDRDHVVFTVSDTGIGVAPDRRQAIFESFRQADATHARRFGGAGLGLSISRQLVALMGGGIAVTEREGGGSVFSFDAFLPEEEDPRGFPLDIIDPEATSDVKPIRRVTLLAEDNPVNAEVARESLTRAGHVVLSASNGLEALRLLAERTCDVALMDVEMPEMDGLEASRAIRAGRAGEAAKSLPIIGVTAHALVEVKRQCLKAGMDACVTKPVDFKKLLALIEDVLGPAAPSNRPASAATSPPLRSDSPAGILDKEGALRRLQGNAELYESVAKAFLESAPERLRAIGAAVAAGDAPETASLAHAFAGSLAALGADTSQALARGLMAAARGDDAARMRVLFELLEEELEKATPLLLS